MWKLFAFIMYVGAAIALWSLTPDVLTPVWRIIMSAFVAGVYLAVLANLACTYRACNDLAEILAGGIACYGWAHAPVPQALQGALLSASVVIMAIMIISGYFARDWKLMNTT